MTIMKNLSAKVRKGAIATALCAMALPAFAQETTTQQVTGWGDWKLFLDPGHSGTENQGLWGYSEAEKVLSIALTIKEYLTTYTDMPADNLMLCREDGNITVGLSERSDMANAWGADFYYSIHSDASQTNNTTVTLFGGWMNNGVEVEKTPNGGKAYGEILNPNLTNVMMQFACTGTRGNFYDRCYYYPGETTHANQYPYLSVNRESNMASLLSEGGYHTIAAQQQLNINNEYKRIEALAAFQSLLKFHGMEVPAQTMLAGIITNSENDTPINGVTVTVDGKTYTTDTWESVFNKYTKNENLIHNGFYFFEGLTAGQTYDVTFSKEGFESKTVQVTIKEGGQGETVDFVTVQHIELTNTAPAKVDAISIDDITNVTPVDPLVITFSRNMDKASVEQALSINNKGEIALSWINDYTLSIDISKLLPLWDYTITIDGSIAKNSQTSQLFDGDGDGVEGGNYELTITMAEPDVTAPVVVSTYPAADGQAVYTHRPPIRIEFSEVINYNEDKNGSCITVTDKDGNSYSGSVTHAVVRDASVLHYYFDEDLPLDKCFLVSVAGGLEDLSGNVSEQYYFRFLSEHRNTTEANVLFALNSADGFWAPNGSGSTSGLTDEGSSFESTTITPSKAVSGAAKLVYSFDPDFADEVWQIREYTPTQSGTNGNRTDCDYIVSFWLYGDGSNNSVSAMLRINNSELKVTDPMTTIDFRGWTLVTWDLQNDAFQHFTGEATEMTQWRFDSFLLKHEWTDEEDESVPYQAWTGEIIFNSLEYNKWDNTAVQSANIEDVAIPGSGVENVIASDNASINITCNGDNVIVNALDAIDKVVIYNVSGQQLKSVAASGNQAIISIENLAEGVYIVTAHSAGNVVISKIVK